MNDNPTYIQYANGDKVDIGNINYPLLIEEMVEVDLNSDMDKIKSILKDRVNRTVDFCIEKRGPVEDTLVTISGPGINELTQKMGPLYEDIEIPKTGQKLIRYARSIKFV